MVEKSKGKIVTGSLSIAAAALIFISSLLGLITYAVMGVFNYYFYFHLIFMLGGIALLVLGVLGLIRFRDVSNRKIGMASVITFLVIEGLFLIIEAILMIANSIFVFDVDLVLFLLASIALTVAFFVCGKKMPVYGTEEEEQVKGK